MGCSPHKTPGEGSFRIPPPYNASEDTTMNRSLHTACLLLAATFIAPLTGCTIKAEVEPLVRYEGTPETATVPYTAGVPVRVVSANGAVNVSSGGTGEVQITFSPFAMGEEGAAQAAKDEMEKYLQFNRGGAGEIVIEVVKDPNGSGGLGADIDVLLPAELNGDFSVAQSNGSVDVDLSGTSAASTIIASDNGSVDVLGARGRLDVFTDNGSVDVAVAAWAIAGSQDGRVASGNGDITFTVPAAADGTMTVIPAGQILEEGIPTTWQAAENASGKSYTMGAGTGGHVEVTNAEGLGDITIIGR